MIARLFDYLSRYEVFDIFSSQTRYMVPWEWLARRLSGGYLDYGKRGQYPCQCADESEEELLNTRNAPRPSA